MDPQKRPIWTAVRVFFPITILTKASSMLVTYKVRVSINYILSFLLDLLQRPHSFKRAVVNLLVHTFIDEFNFNLRRHVRWKREEWLVSMVMGS